MCGPVARSLTFFHRLRQEEGAALQGVLHPDFLLLLPLQELFGGTIQAVLEHLIGGAVEKLTEDLLPPVILRLHEGPELPLGQHHDLPKLSGVHMENALHFRRDSA